MWEIMNTNTRKYLTLQIALVLVTLLAACSKEADRVTSGQSNDSGGASVGPATQQKAGGASQVASGHEKAGAPSLPKNHGPRTPMMPTRLQDAPLLDIFEAEGVPIAPTRASPSVKAVQTFIGHTPVIEVRDPSAVSRVVCSVSLGGSSAKVPAQFWQSMNRAAVWDPYAGFASVEPQDWGVYRSFHDILNEPSHVGASLTVTVTYQDASSWKCSFHRRDFSPVVYSENSEVDYGPLSSVMDSARTEVEKREAWKPEPTTECGVRPLSRGGTNLYQVIITRWNGSRRKLDFDTAGTLLDYSCELTFPNPMSAEVLKMWELATFPGP